MTTKIHNDHNYKEMQNNHNKKKNDLEETKTKRQNDYKHTKRPYIILKSCQTTSKRHKITTK